MDPLHFLLDLMTKASKSADAHWKSISFSTTTARSSSNQTWKPPPSGWIKINCDASFLNGKA